METLQSLTDIQNKITLEAFDHDKKYNHVRSELNTKLTPLYVLWNDAFENRLNINLEQKEELANYVGSIYERIESGKLEREYEIEACLNVLMS